MSPIESRETLESENEARPSTAETAECQCPKFCERDHGLDAALTRSVFPQEVGRRSLRVETSLRRNA